MKSRKSKLILLSLVVLGVVAWSPPNSEDLIVGVSPSVTSPGGYVAVVGDSNVVSARNTLVAGLSNSVPAGAPTTSSSFVAGYNNTVAGAPPSAGATSAAAIGVGNQIMAEFGWAIGYANEVSGRTSMALGYDNQVSAQKANALGRGLKVTQNFSTAVGTYNAVPMVSGDVFVVGSGSSDTIRNTALRVTSDGGVILGRAQGDISMGAYAN